MLVSHAYFEYVVSDCGFLGEHTISKSCLMKGFAVGCVQRRILFVIRFLACARGCL